jgi:hypothetical protein
MPRTAGIDAFRAQLTALRHLECHVNNADLIDRMTVLRGGLELDPFGRQLRLFIQTVP